MHRRKVLTLGIALATVSKSALGIVAQEGKTRTVNGGGLEFDVPTAWKSVRPSGTMRRLQMAIPATAGDMEDCECVLFVFPGGAGSVDANIERWAGQFRTEAGTPPKAQVTKAMGKNTKVTRVEMAGRYVAPIAPGNPESVNKPGFALTAAIVEAPEVSYFLKVTGPEKTMKAAKSDFDALIASMRLQE